MPLPTQPPSRTHLNPLMIYKAGIQPTSQFLESSPVTLEHNSNSNDDMLDLPGVSAPYIFHFSIACTWCLPFSLTPHCFPSFPPRYSGLWNTQPARGHVESELEGQTCGAPPWQRYRRP